jgi:hypothetical protein
LKIGFGWDLRILVPAGSRRYQGEAWEGLIVNLGLKLGLMSNLGGGKLALRKYWLIRKVPLLEAQS